MLICENEAIELLKKFGINYPRYQFVSSKQQLALVLETFGFPVVLKVVSKDISHKSDVGGVRINIKTSEEAFAAFDDIYSSVLMHSPGAIIEGLLVCEQAPSGLEMIIGMKKDEIFGNVIIAGLGGIFAETIRDVAIRIGPVSAKEALEMVNELKGYSLLNGARGQKRLDIEAITQVISAISEMCDEINPQEVDLNPVRVYENGVLALDARIII